MIRSRYNVQKLNKMLLCICVSACTRRRTVSTADQFTTETLNKKTNESLLKTSESRFIRKEEENEKIDEIKMMYGDDVMN